MSINFNHTQSSNIVIQTSNDVGSGVVNFPKTNTSDPIEILISGHSNISYISGLSDYLSGNESSFYSLNQINGQCSYSYSPDSGSLAQACNSIIFGKSGVAKYNYIDIGGEVNSQIVHSMPGFSCIGDAQNTIFLSKTCTTNDSCSPLIYATVCNNTLIFGDFDVIGKGQDKYAAFKVKSSLVLDTGYHICTGSFNVTTLLSCNLNQNFCIGITGSCLDSQDWSLYVCNACGINWLTRASILEVAGTGSANVAYGTYWHFVVDNDWFNLANWFLTNQFEGNASYLPICSSNVYMYGDLAACVNLDCNLWVQPHSIDTTNSTSPEGICLYSQSNCVFSGIVYGNVSMFGNTIFI